MSDWYDITRLGDTRPVLLEADTGRIVELWSWWFWVDDPDSESWSWWFDDPDSGSALVP